MKDIRSLYRAAKYSGRKTDISSYREAVDQLLENSPIDYILQLEYIIQSDIGLSTVSQFIEKYGLSIPVCDHFLETTEMCRDKAKEKNIPHDGYDQLITVLESFKKKYSECFSMFDFYSQNDPKELKEYVETYYGSTNGVANRLNVDGMIKKFKERAVPDLLINANTINENAIVQLMNRITSDNDLVNPVFCEYVNAAVKNLSTPNHGDKIHSWLESHSISPLVQSFEDYTNQVYRESVIMGEFDRCIDFTESDITNVLSLIHIKESMMIGIDDPDKLIQIQESIYSLYQLLDGYVTESGDIMEDVADSVVPMLPISLTRNGFMEDISWANTTNKKKGTIPNYLSDNHELALIGEDDENKSPDEYKRKSADDISDPSERSDDKYNSYDDRDDDRDDEKEDEKDPKRSGNVNNYYYYTYTNSLNRNQNSFNRDNDYSHRDDHRSYHNDHSTKNDDHSTHRHTTISKTGEKSVTAKTEAASTINDNRPESDHPIRDIMIDVDRKTTAVQQKAKKGIQNVQNIGRAFMKPIRRTDMWISKMISTWKDSNENNIKERMADPHARKNLYNTIKTAIINGSLLKAGLLLNPIFLYMKLSKSRNTMRIRNEMIGEIKTELEICDEKIKDCADTPDGHRMKYKLMRFKNELNKKLIRVGGGKGMAKII